MTEDRWRRVKALFQEAAERAVAERDAFLAAATGDDEALRCEIESLLASDAEVGSAFDRFPRAAEGLLAESPSGMRVPADQIDGHPNFGPGRRIGAYEVVEPLGAGAMGEVYRARDTKLNRDIALKVLPELFANDPERLARFSREAQMLAALNHPNIAAIYGLEETGSGEAPIPALVLELIDGPTLADRIALGPLPMGEAVSIARQIADALEAAHEKGIVHRDLKPANVKITPAGLVKVLDFGLAKAAVDGSTSELSRSPTITAGGTREGIILGTAAYMSPEQARGKPVDKRTDIWAFGCVLYEMLTGCQAFGGETVSDAMAAVLERQPNWRALPASTPASLRRLMRRCLEKDLTKRLRDIGDASIELDEAMPGARRRLSTPAIPGFGRSGWWAVAGAVGVSVIAAALYVRGGRDPAEQPSSGSRLQPKFNQLTSQPGVEWFPSLSPDGKWVVYSAEGSGNRDVYLQSVTGQMPINLTADSRDDDDQPAFSPDGERIAFRSSRDGGGIFVMGRTGESVRRITRTGFTPAWSPDGSQLAFSTENVQYDPQNTNGPSTMWVVNVTSGEQRQLSHDDAVLPSWSPGGHRIAYTTRRAGMALDIWTVDRSGGGQIAVTTDGVFNWNPVWSPDGQYLYFVSGRGGAVNLWRVAIDEPSGHVRGRPEPVTTPASFVAHLTISADGARIAYSSMLRSRNIQKLAIDPVMGTPKGDPTWVTTGSRLWSNPDPSPDGQWVTFYSGLQPEGDVYVARIDGTGLRQLTSEPDVVDRTPRWSPDGRWITFFSNRTKDTTQLWKIRPDGSDLQQVTAFPGAVFPVFSRDGSRLAVTGDSGVCIFDPNRPWKEQTPEILPPLNKPERFIVNSWSPNGERLAGQDGLNFATRGILTYSLKSRTFKRWTDFGEFPVWLADSHHVLFVSRGKDFHVLDTRSGKTQKVFSVQRDVIGPAQLSRDRSEAYFSRRVTESDIWLLTLDTGKPVK